MTPESPPPTPTLIIANTDVGGVPSDILVARDRIVAIEPHDPGRVVGPDAGRVDGSGTAALPGLLNAHTHAAMVVMRGYADDMHLMPWLEEKIWPFEVGQTAEDV